MTTHLSVVWPLNVFYDAACPLCRAEMEALKARDSGDLLRLVDCSPPSFNLADGLPPDVTPAMMMARMHARDGAGHWLKGVDVFVAVYYAAGCRKLSWLYACRPLRPVLDWAYPWIADNRYRLSRWGLPKLLRALIGPASTQVQCDGASRSCARRPET